MQTKPANWDAIFASEHLVDTKLIIGGVTYNHDKIVSVKTNGALYEKFGIGNCCSRMLEVEFYPTATPARQAQVQVQCRLASSSKCETSDTVIVDTTTYTGSMMFGYAYIPLVNKYCTFIECGDESGYYSAITKANLRFTGTHDDYHVSGSITILYSFMEQPVTIVIGEDMTEQDFKDTTMTDIAPSGTSEYGVPYANASEVLSATEFKIVSERATDYIPKGTFYISKRETDHATGTLKLTCYDAMLKAEQPFTEVFDDYTDFPMNPTTCVSAIATAMGITVDSRTSINNSFLVEYPVDEDGDMTLREMLGRIAVANAGNFIVTDTNQLRLVPLASTATPISLGTQCSSLDKGIVSEAIGKVDVVNNSGELLQEWPFGTFTGKVLTATYPDATPNGGAQTQAANAVAYAIYTAVSGYVQYGFNAKYGLIDPCAELGDRVTVGTTGNTLTSTIASENITFDALYTSDISAPDADEVDDEYPYLTYQQKTSKQIASTYSAIKKSAEEISLLVSGIADAWTSNTSYALNDVVGYEGKFYKCTTAHTSGSTFDATKWSEISNGIVQSIFSQTKNKISIGVTSAEGSSTFTIKQGGIDIATETLNLTVSSAYISGTLSATQIKTSELIVGDTVTMGDNATISWNKVTNQPTILSTNDVNGLIGTYIDSTSIAAAYLKGQYIYIYGSNGTTQYGTIYAGTNTAGTTALELYGSNGLRLNSNGNTFLTSNNGGLILLGYDSSAGGTGALSGTHINALYCGSFFCMGSGYYDTAEPGNVVSNPKEGMLYFKITS